MDKEPTDFGVVAAMPPAEQRRLLSTGDAPARLFAAWAITLRLGADALPIVRTAALGDIPEGLRQQFLVILAGLGERAILREIGENDASLAVRATACTYYLRTAPSPGDPDALDFGRARLHASSHLVRLAVLEEYEAGRVHLLERDVAVLLKDPDETVRRAALLCFAGLAEPSPDTLTAIAPALVEDADAEMRAAIIRVIPRERIRAVMTAIASAEAARIADMLRALVEHFGSLTWSEVAPLEDRRETRAMIALLKALASPLPVEAMHWAGIVYENALANPTGSRELYWRIHEALLRSLSPSNVGSLDPRTLVALARELEREIGVLRGLLEEQKSFGHDDNDYEDDPSESIARLESILLILAQSRALA